MSTSFFRRHLNAPPLRVSISHHALTHFSGMIESNYDEVTDSFDNMNLKPELLRGIYAYGFERPSAIQQRAIMPIMGGQFRAFQSCRASPDSHA